MADYGYGHSSEILTAAIPYISGRSRPTLTLFVKMYELMDCVRGLKNNNLNACGFEEQKVDVEGLLKAIRPKCSDKERAFIDQMLTFYNAKRMMEMYNTYMEAMKTMQEFQGFSSGDSEGSSNAENIFSNFSGFDFSSIFGSGNSTGTEDPDISGEARDDNPDLHFTSEEHTSEDSPYEEYSYGDEDEDEGFYEGEAFNDSSNEDSSGSTEDSQKTVSQNKQSSMLDMLKAMIPPEQQSTFNNLSMLFNSMSYDDNKSEQNKE